MATLSPLFPETNLVGTLQSAITSSATSISVAFKDAVTGAARTPLATTLVFVIDKGQPGLPNEKYEIIEATSHSTASSVTTITVNKRGCSLSAKTLTAGTGTAHSASAEVGVADVHYFTSHLAALANGEYEFPNPLKLLSTAIPIFDANPTLTDDKHVATKKYADDLAIAGAPDGTATVKGIYELATSAESQAGTDSGSTTATLVAKPSDIAANDQNRSHTFAADAEASDTYAITLAPAPSAYATGQQFSFTANTANTGAATLNVNALGAKTIKKYNDQDLETGDIEAGQVVNVVYDGTNLQMTSQVATGLDTGDMSVANATTLTDGSNADTLHIHTGSGAFHAEYFATPTITGTGNTDQTITTSFLAKGIELDVQASIPGSTTPRTLRGRLVFDGTTLKYFNGINTTKDTSVAALIGDVNVFGTSATFTTTGTDSWSVTFSIQSLGATSFVVRVASTGSGAPSTFLVNIGVKSWA